MNEFRTIVSITESARKIGLADGVFTIGSCFADAIGERLVNSKFLASANPFGVVYNPISIHRILRYSIAGEVPAESSYLERDQLHFNFDFHSSLSGSDRTMLKEKVSSEISRANRFLKAAKWLMITYGTAWLYARKDNNAIVANCHKLPASRFDKRLATENELVESFSTLHSELTAFNPSIRMILTASPVRHLKDTLELNSVSKAMLRLACHRLSTTFESVDYFPAYEMMMDDLRDYRFYKSDMLHPTELAEDYIWEKFGQRYCERNTLNFIDAWKNIRAALSHRPFHEHSHAHQQFLRSTLKKLEELKSVVNVDEEIRVLKARLINQ